MNCIGGHSSVILQTALDWRLVVRKCRCVRRGSRRWNLEVSGGMIPFWLDRASAGGNEQSLLHEDSPNSLSRGVGGGVSKKCGRRSTGRLYITFQSSARVVIPVNVDNQPAPP
jgi:hypothetical protein